MNKYTELSDFEVNKNVAEKLGLAYEVTRYGVVTRMSNKEQWREFNPCNNPADAMPIVIDNGIVFMPSKALDSCYCVKGDYSSANKSLYRAAMEVFLMMKDKENKKMTEFEINKAVAEKAGIKYTTGGDKVYEMFFFSPDSQPIPYEFDPCNKVEQAWKIMLSYGITIVFQKGKYQFATIDGEIEIKHEKPLVSAMLCFLEINK